MGNESKGRTCQKYTASGIKRTFAGRNFVPSQKPLSKTYNPYYENLLAKRLKEVLSDSASPLHSLLDLKQVTQFLDNPKDYGAPWYGQLMAGPQMIAYLLQIEYFLRKYNVSIRI